MIGPLLFYGRSVFNYNIHLKSAFRNLSQDLLDRPAALSEPYQRATCRLPCPYEVHQLMDFVWR
jgi:hypothetical protein